MDTYDSLKTSWQRGHSLDQPRRYVRNLIMTSILKLKSLFSVWFGSHNNHRENWSKVQLLGHIFLPESFALSVLFKNISPPVFAVKKTLSRKNYKDNSRYEDIGTTSSNIQPPFVLCNWTSHSFFLPVERRRTAVSFAIRFHSSFMKKLSEDVVDCSEPLLKNCICI